MLSWLTLLRVGSDLATLGRFVLFVGLGGGWCSQLVPLCCRPDKLCHLHWRSGPRSLGRRGTDLHYVKWNKQQQQPWAGAFHSHSVGVVTQREGAGEMEKGKWIHIFESPSRARHQEDPYIQAQTCFLVSVSLKSKRLWKHKVWVFICLLIFASFAANSFDSKTKLRL